MNKKEILKLLEKEKIDYIYEEHPPVFSMEDLFSLNPEHGKDIALTLFLRDDKKKNYYLLSTDRSMKPDLKALKHILGTRPLSYASDRDFERILRLKKESASLFGIFNDEEQMAEAVIDIRFQNRLIGVHPLINTATVFLKGDDLYRLLQEKGISVRWAEFRQFI